MAAQMAVELDRNGLEVLDRAECLRLLSTAALGRVGTSTAALPVVLPVPYRVVGDEVLFRVGPGSTLDPGIVGTVVAFEVDDLDPMLAGGWTVVVTGVARHLGPIEARAAGDVPGWSDAEGGIVAVATDLVAGRRVVPR